MSSTSETGHAKNVANFEDLIAFCKSYGATYSPSRPALQIASLELLRAEANAKQQQVKAARTAFDNATNARRQAFKPLRFLCTRLVNAIAASGAGPLAVADARTINRKIQGAKAPSGKTKPLATDPASPASTPKTISIYQQSFDSLVDHLAKLQELIAQQDGYAPNEADLSAVGVSNYIKQLHQANSGVISTFTNWSNARVQRDETLYNPLSGLVPAALSVRLYVKSIFGGASPQYKQVSAIPFRSIPGK